MQQTTVRALTDLYYFQFLILGYCLGFEMQVLWRNLLSIPHFRIRAAGLLYDLVNTISLSIPHFRIPNRPHELNFWAYCRFQFLILGYIIGFGGLDAKTTKLSIPHFRIPPTLYNHHNQAYKYFQFLILGYKSLYLVVSLTWFTLSIPHFRIQMKPMFMMRATVLTFNSSF